MALSTLFESYKVWSQRWRSKPKITETSAELPQHTKVNQQEYHSTLRYLSDHDKDEKTVWYLAYGSNLAAETFEGRRNIHPIQAFNVVVPQLRLVFDLPGIPYSEPCFANSAVRDGYDPPGGEQSVLLHNDNHGVPGYHKDRWKKGMVGVAYELTPSDYAHVLATEGGGASYLDVVVDCYILPPRTKDVPAEPTTRQLRAHTLFAPTNSSPGDSKRFSRPDPGYAQPSARYLKLLSDGAVEHSLPQEYQDYIHQIRPYRITSRRQMVGKYIFTGLWTPIIFAFIRTMSMFSDRNGKVPEWVAHLASTLFTALWSSYDRFFHGPFGDGERTEGETRDSMDEKGEPLHYQLSSGALKGSFRPTKYTSLE